MIRVESLDQEGRGVAHAGGKVIFIQGALSGELVTYASYIKKPSYEIAQVGKVLEAASARVTPLCPHFGTCGGCSQQHLDARADTRIILDDQDAFVARRSGRDCAHWHTAGRRM